MPFSFAILFHDPQLTCFECLQAANFSYSQLLLSVTGLISGTVGMQHLPLWLDFAITTSC